MLLSVRELDVYRRTEELLYKIYPKLINFPKADRVIYKDKIWTSKIDANTTIPDGDEPYNRYWGPES